MADVARGRELELAPRSAYSESMTPFYNPRWSDLRSLRRESGRYVRAPRPELYDLALDPGEERDLLPEAAERAASYAGEAGRAPERARGGRARRERSGALAGERDTLAALGYVWDPDAESGGLADPKDRVHRWEEAQRANALVRAGQYAEAISALTALLDEDPASITARTALARALILSGDPDEAVEVLRATVAMPGALVSNYLALAQLEREGGDPRWRERVARAQEIAPRDPTPWVFAGDRAREDGDG